MANKCWMPNLNRVDLIFSRLEYIIQKWTFKMSWEITALPLMPVRSFNTQYTDQIDQESMPQYRFNSSILKIKSFYILYKIIVIRNDQLCSLKNCGKIVFSISCLLLSREWHNMGFLLLRNLKEMRFVESLLMLNLKNK